MRNEVLNKYCLFLLLSFNVLNLFGQQEQIYSNNSLRYQLGIGSYNSYDAMGLGGFIGLGYNRNIWKDKLRINPNFKIGSYQKKSILDIPYQVFNSFNLDIRISYDIYKFKSISLMFEFGGNLNYLNGYNGVNSFVPFPQPDYFNTLNFGGLFSSGFRISPSNSLFILEVLPLNFTKGTKGYYEYSFNLGVGIKLK